MIIIQQRSTSTRLPGKCNLSWPGPGNHTITEQILQQCLLVDDTRILVPHGDPLAKNTKLIPHVVEVDVIEDDLIDRYAVYLFGMSYTDSNKMPKYFIRVTGDCPLISPAVIALAKTMLSGGVDYFTNEGTCVDGSDVQGIKTGPAWNWVIANSNDLSLREHMFSVIQKKIDEFKSRFNYYHYVDPYNRKSQFDKLSIDTKEDYDRALKFAKTLREEQQ